MYYIQNIKKNNTISDIIFQYKIEQYLKTLQSSCYSQKKIYIISILDIVIMSISNLFSKEKVNVGRQVELDIAKALSIIFYGFPSHYVDGDGL